MEGGGGTAREAVTLARVQAALAGLRQGLGLMLETQATQTEMLRQLLAAATPAPAESTLAGSLTRIAAILDR